MAFSDTRDFDEQKKGFIAAPDSMKIKADSGHVAWDIERYQFLAKGEDFDSIHPSLQRIATLNLNFGLYEVLKDKIYQVRGFDLANITFVKGKTGCCQYHLRQGRHRLDRLRSDNRGGNRSGGA
jgi:alkyl sulfatase BDS1-like metallo-beta-lactamase superfamily hydrolase